MNAHHASPPTAEILNIGTELVLGETVNTNAVFLARALREAGFDVRRITVVPDRLQEIQDAVREALARSQVLVVTGGLGPTVDDPTREALARALERPLEFRPEEWEAIVARVRARGREPRENARRMAYLPRGALALPNPVGAAPGFVVETDSGRVLMALPGVPREMEAMFREHGLPYLRRRFDLRGETMRVRVLQVEGVPEAWIDEKLGDLEARENPALGLSCGPERVLLRLMARGSTPEEAEALLDEMEAEIRRRLPWEVRRYPGEA